MSIVTEQKMTDATYMVREAVLVKTPNGSAWTVRFVPLAGEPEAEEVLVLISPMDLDNMTFAHPYTLVEIQRFADTHHA
jgi:hypothetical protein